MSMAQNGKMTVNGTMKHKNEDLFFKKLAALSDDRVVIIFQIVDRETREVKGTFGCIPTDGTYQYGDYTKALYQE